MSLPPRTTSADLAATAAAFARWRDATPRLKRRVTEARVAPVSPPASPAFVELTLGLPSSGPTCVLALGDARGRSLRIEWTRPLAGEVAAVALGLWEATA